ncbi:hypothetical protein GJ698_14440 [Pseudoduganella sp. FT26W]|uniref:Uncharacterized protein n=1 Tax=Duganella aquatilis TaxID=2666082 RepID=A0A844DBW9_9BURK|nr:hypothetical protein [Duganella aquatilis]MRW85280.1 hypothetical protein [Duganella aquatilis]
MDPLTQANWERTGVQPDVNVPAARALDVALAQISKASSAVGLFLY